MASATEQGGASGGSHSRGGKGGRGRVQVQDREEDLLCPPSSSIELPELGLLNVERSVESGE